MKVLLMKIKSALMQGGAHSIAGTKGILVFSLLLHSQVVIYLVMRFFYDVELMRFLHDIELNVWVLDTSAFMLGGISPIYYIFVIRGLITSSSGCHTKAMSQMDARQRV